MNRVYLPYPIELIAKLVSWLAVLVVDSIEFILKPVMRIGVKCFVAFTAVAAIFCGYSYFHYSLTIGQALLQFGALIALFAAFVAVVRLVNLVLVKVVRPPLANVIFAPVAISFRMPFVFWKVRA